ESLFGLGTRTVGGRPIHPGKHDIGTERLDCPAQGTPRGQVERAAERGRGDIDSAVPQHYLPALVRANDEALAQAAFMERHGQTREKSFRAAFRRSSHGLKDAHQPIRSAPPGDSPSSGSPSKWILSSAMTI